MTILIIAAVLAFLIYNLYVGLIKKRNAALESLSAIDVQLKMRSDLIPNILVIAKKYMEHERTLLEEITSLRAKSDAPYDKTNPSAVSEHLNNTAQLASRMGALNLTMEAYPTLKADGALIESKRSYN